MCSPPTETTAESKDDDSESEEKTTAVASQPQRIALFPGVDPSALKVSSSQLYLQVY